MEDIAPDLLKKIQTDFQASLVKNRKVSAVYKKLDENKATYKDCNIFAEEVGNALAGAYDKNLSSDILPDGRLYYNIAEKTVRPTMEENYELISDVTVRAQDAMNKDGGVGLKAQKADLNKDRIDKLIDIVSDAAHFDDVKEYLNEPVVNFSRNVVDSTIQKNAELHSKAGMNTKIIRTVQGETCDWCKSLAGTYNYDDVRDTGNDVWRRHQNCDCLIELVSYRGRETVFNYREDNTAEARAKRQQATRNLTESKEFDTIKKYNGLLRMDLQFFAQIPRAKFTKYALDETADKNKATAFRKALGYTKDNCDSLIKQIENKVDINKCIYKKTNEYGDLYEQTMEIVGVNGKTANVRTGWIIKNGESELTLTSIYVTKKRPKK